MEAGPSIPDLMPLLPVQLTAVGAKGTVKEVQLAVPLFADVALDAFRLQSHVGIVTLDVCHTVADLGLSWLRWGLVHGDLIRRGPRGGRLQPVPMRPTIRRKLGWYRGGGLLAGGEQMGMRTRTLTLTLTRIEYWDRAGGGRNIV